MLRAGGRRARVRTPSSQTRQTVGSLGVVMACETGKRNGFCNIVDIAQPLEQPLEAQAKCAAARPRCVDEKRAVCYFTEVPDYELVRASVHPAVR